MNNQENIALEDGGSHFQRLQKRRIEFTEILVTAVLFGLAVNLVSDIISSLTVNYGLFIGVGSSILIMLLLGYLFWLQIGKYTHFKDRMVMTVMWDSDSGKIAERETGYLPHLVLRAHYEKAKQTTTKHLSKLLQTTPEEVSKKENTLLRVLSEGILFGILNRMSKASSLGNQKGIGDIIPRDNWLLVDAGGQLQMYVPERASVRYYVKSTKSGKLKLKWKYGCLGCLELKFAPLRIDWYSDKPDQEMILDPFDLE